MQFHRVFTFLLVVGLSLTLAACGGASGGNDSDNGGDGDAQSSAVELPETASATVATGGSVSINYPAGWTATPADGAGTVGLVGDSEKGEAASVVYISSVAASALAGGGEASPAAILENMSQGVLDAEAGVTAGEVTDVTVNGLSGSMMTASGDGATAVFYVLEVDDGYAFVSGVSNEASDDFTATIEAIAGSVSFSA